MTTQAATLLLLLALALAVVPTQSRTQNGASGWYSVYLNPTTQQYSVSPGKDVTGAVAWAEWADERYTTGWARFNLEANSVYGDSAQAYGAGFLEGYLSTDLIWSSWSNTLQNAFAGKPKPEILQFFQQNLAWTLGQVALYAKTDPYWMHVHLVMQQLNGLAAGYAAKQTNSSRKMDFINFLVLNAGGDIETIGNKFRNVSEPAPMLMKGGSFGTHCSSVIKVAPDMSELYAGHTTWGSFYGMIRIFKTYAFSFTAPTVAASTLFSSYPACLSSIDDFYQLSSKLVVIETTNGISFNPSLYNQVVPQNLLSWIRIIVANRMAQGGKSWVDTFSRYNSGTYNNQWIIVDYSLFKPHEPLPPNLLWIAEQIPGLVESADVTSYLRNGYWPSYNIPFFPRIYEESGFTNAIKTYGDWLTYDLHPRAQIFRRDANNIKNMQDYMNILRYNNWKQDPLADGSPGNQISSRFDLVPPGPPPPNPFLVRAAFGGTDSKATNSRLLAEGRVFAQSGPTHDSLQPFDWRVGGWTNLAHDGMPDLWNFGWIDMPSGRNASATLL